MRRYVVPARLLRVVTVALAAVALPAGALAYFVNFGFGSGSTRIGSVNPPSDATITQGGASLTVEWAAATTASGAPVQGYTVKRPDGTVICGSPTLDTALLCEDPDPPTDSSPYTITAFFGGFTAAVVSAVAPGLTAPVITASPSDPSTSPDPSFGFDGGGGTGYRCALDAGPFVRCSSQFAYSALADGPHSFQVEATAGASSGPVTTYRWLEVGSPIDRVSLAGPEPDAFMDAGAVYYNGNAAGSLQLTDAVTDQSSAPVSATFPDVSTAGWTHPAETVTSGTGQAPTISYTSSTFSWIAGAVPPTGYVVSSADAGGYTSGGEALSFVSDTTPPAGGGLIVNGTAATPFTSVSTGSSTGFAINSRVDFTEPLTATQSGLRSSVVTVQSESLTAGVCGPPGSGGPFPTATVITGTSQPAGIAVGACYLYVLAGTDNVGNATTVSTTVQLPGTALTVAPAGTGTASQGLSTPACLKPLGSIHGSIVGSVHLGMRAAAVETLFRQRNRTYYGTQRLCVRGGDDRVEYPTRRLLSLLGATLRRSLANRVVMALTSNPHYRLRGVSHGTRIALAIRRLKLRPGLRLGLNTWYLGRTRDDLVVVKERAGVVREIGYVDRRLVNSDRQLARFFSTFRNSRARRRTRAKQRGAGRQSYCEPCREPSISKRN